MTGGSVSKRTDSIVRLRDEVCHYCGVAPGATLDHIVPDVFGGAYMLWNLVPACQKCNHDKGSTWPTCPCTKCQDAIARHIGDPVFRLKVESVLDHRERSLVKSIRMLKEKVAALDANLDDFRTYRRKIREHLTDHIIDSKVEA